jgi:hypothetical protein
MGDITYEQLMRLGKEIALPAMCFAQLVIGGKTMRFVLVMNAIQLSRNLFRCQELFQSFAGLSHRGV